MRLESAIPAPFLSWESGRRDLNSNLQAVQKSLTLFSPLAQQKKPSRANVANAPDSRQSVRIDRPLRQNAFSRKRRRFVKIRSVMELPVCKKLSRSSPLRFPVLLPSPRLAVALDVVVTLRCSALHSHVMNSPPCCICLKYLSEIEHHCQLQKLCTQSIIQNE